MSTMDKKPGRGRWKGGNKSQGRALTGPLRRATPKQDPSSLWSVRSLIKIQRIWCTRWCTTQLTEMMVSFNRLQESSPKSIDDDPSEWTNKTCFVCGDKEQPIPHWLPGWKECFQTWWIQWQVHQNKRRLLRGQQEEWVQLKEIEVLQEQVQPIQQYKRPQKSFHDCFQIAIYHLREVWEFRYHKIWWRVCQYSIHPCWLNHRSGTDIFACKLIQRSWHESHVSCHSVDDLSVLQTQTGQIHSQDTKLHEIPQWFLSLSKKKRILELPCAVLTTFYIHHKLLLWFCMP